MSKLISGQGSDLVTLYHGTSKENAASIKSDGYINGPVFLNANYSVAEDHAGVEGVVLTVEIPANELTVAFDDNMLDFETAKEYYDVDWDSIHDVVMGGISVVIPRDIHFK